MHIIQKGNIIEQNNNTWWINEKNQISIKCPNGHIGVLPHNIDKNGIVTPSIDCGGHPHRLPCNFHEFAKLENWKT